MTKLPIQLYQKFESESHHCHIDWDYEMLNFGWSFHATSPNSNKRQIRIDPVLYRCGRLVRSLRRYCAHHHRQHQWHHDDKLGYDFYFPLMP